MFTGQCVQAAFTMDCPGDLMSLGSIQSKIKQTADFESLLYSPLAGIDIADDKIRSRKITVSHGMLR